MTANALNITAPNAAAAGAAVKAAGPNAAAQAGNPLAGFEALLAALFPQADPVAAGLGKAGAGASAKGAGMVAAEAPAGVSDDEDGDKDADAALGDVIAGAVDPNTALVACMLRPALPAHDPASAAAEGASGRRQPSPPPGAPVLVPVTKAGDPTAEVAPDAEDPGADAAAKSQQTLADALAARSDAAAFGRDKARGAPAAPALANANPHADLAQKAEARAVTEAPPAPLDAPPVAAPDAGAAATTTAAAAAPNAAPRAEAANRNAKPGKPEKGAKASAEPAAIGEAKAPSAAGKTETAKAVSEAAKPAAADAEAAEAHTNAGKASSEPAEPTFSLDARPTTETTGSTAHATHAVRGSPETVANLAAQIVKKLEAKTTRFDVELDPLGLGKVNVRVEIGAQGALTAAMSFDNPQAAADVRARAAELHKALEQAGFNLSGGISFDVASERGQQQQNQAWQDQGENGRAFRGQAFRAALDTAGEADQAASTGALRLRRGVTAGLDVRI